MKNEKLRYEIGAFAKKIYILEDLFSQQVEG